MLLILIGFWLLAGLACKALSPQPPEPTEASQRPAVKIATATPAQAQAGGEEGEPTEAEAQPAPTEFPDATPTRIPTDTPVPQAQPLVVSDPWFAHDNQSPTIVWYAFFLENPNSDLAVVDTQFQVVGYDASGSVLATANVEVPAIFPGERLALGGLSSLNVPENTQVDKLEVQASREGEARRFEIQGSPFKTDKVSYFHTEYRDFASGLIQNLVEDGSLTHVAVTAIAFDANGKIIGAGSNNYVPFIPAGGQIGVVIDMHMTTDDIPAQFELYPTLSYGWEVIKTAEQGPTAEVIATGFSQEEYGSVNFAFIARNPSADKPVQYAQYQATAFDELGLVVAVSTGSVSLIFPGESLGLAGLMSAPEKKTVARVEVVFAPPPGDQYDSWNLEKLGLKENPLTAEAPKYFDDRYNPKVTGIVKNAYTKEVNANVTVVAYNAAGEIIGGGYTFVTIPAEGQAAIEVYVRVSEKPDRIEVYPSLSNPPSD
jgi:hypothetical protein